MIHSDYLFQIHFMQSRNFANVNLAKVRGNPRAKSNNEEGIKKEAELKKFKN